MVMMMMMTQINHHQNHHQANNNQQHHHNHHHHHHVVRVIRQAMMMMMSQNISIPLSSSSSSLSTSSTTTTTLQHDNLNNINNNVTRPMFQHLVQQQLNDTNKFDFDQRNDLNYLQNNFYTTTPTNSTLQILNVTEDVRSFLRNIVASTYNSTYNTGSGSNVPGSGSTSVINHTHSGTTITSSSNVGTTTTTVANDTTSSTFNGSLSINGIGDDDVTWSWWNTWNSKPFPSGYTQLAIVLLAFFLTCIIILVVVGNLLVCIAIATEKSLKPVQNWFIASLAVSDLLIGLIIMPFSLARELMGYWMFGQVWCDIHDALDILLCTASINSLFLISLDRYWSITRAVKYLKERTPSRAAMMIAFVWIFSAFVSLPALVGWKKPEQSSEYPQCNLSDDIGYVLYSSIGSFYFPALMMVFVYAKIFIAARSRARKHIAKKRFKIPSTLTTNADAFKEKSTTTTLCTSFSNPSPPENNNNNNVTTTANNTNNNNEKEQAEDRKETENNANNNEEEQEDEDEEEEQTRQEKLKTERYRKEDEEDDELKKNLIFQVENEDEDDNNIINNSSSSNSNTQQPQIRLESSTSTSSKMMIMAMTTAMTAVPNRISVQTNKTDMEQQLENQEMNEGDGIDINGANNNIVNGADGIGGGISLPPQIIIETSSTTSESRRQSWNIISTSELISSITTDNNQNNNQNQNNQNQIQHKLSSNEEKIQQPTSAKVVRPLPPTTLATISLSSSPLSTTNFNKINETNNNEDNMETTTNPATTTKKRMKYFVTSKRKISKTFQKFQKSKKSGLNRRNTNSISSQNNDNNSTIDDDSDTADSPTGVSSTGGSSSVGTTKDHIRLRFHHPHHNKQTHNETKTFLSAPKLLRSRFGSTLSIADYEDSDVVLDVVDDNSKMNKMSKIVVVGGGGATASSNANNNNNGSSNAKNRVQYQDQAPIHLPSDAERHKRKIAKARERRATLIVGLIMAAFITAWLPFFVLYVLVALCQKCKETIPEGVFATAFWLGYANSAANPIIYTIFNRDYRRAFRKILFKR